MANRFFFNKEAAISDSPIMKKLHLAVRSA